MAKAEAPDELRRSLKKWEAAFVIVHQRKPNKGDIETAPKDIREKYRLYYESKKSSAHTDKSIVTPSKNAEPSTKPDVEAEDNVEVWSVSLNKKKDSTVQSKSLKEEKSGDSQKLLDKMGEKLFQNSHGSTKCARKPRGVFAKPSLCEDPAGTKPEISFDDVSTTPTLKACKTPNLSLEPARVIVKEKLQTDSPATKDQSDKDQDGYDLVVKGGIFKNAEKFLKKSGASKSSCPSGRSLSVTKPRLSYLSKNFTRIRSMETFGLDEVDGSATTINGSHPNTESFTFFDTTDVSPISAGHKMKNTTGKQNSNSPNKSEGPAFKTSDVTLESANTSKPELLFESKGNGKSDCVVGSNKDSSTTPPQTHFSHVSNTMTLASPSQTGQQGRQLIDDAQDNKISAESRLTFPKVVRRRPAERIKGQISEEESPNKVTTPSPTEAIQARPQKRKIQPVETDSYANADDSPGLNDNQETLNVELESEEYKETRTPSAAKKSAPIKRSAAALNDNFVCLNMKRKGYRRKGSAGLTAGQLRKKQWKAKMSARSQSFGANKCFKCGQEGHWASKCKGKSTEATRWNRLDSKASGHAESGPVDESEFPSLRQAALMARGTVREDSTGMDETDITDIEASIIRERLAEAEDSATPVSVEPLTATVEGIHPTGS